MIRKSILLLALVLPALITDAQYKNTKPKKTTITIVREEDGKTTRIDTTFINAEDATIEAFFEKNGVKPTPPTPPTLPTPPAPGVPPPPPPAPPLPNDESSFNFHFSMPDFDTSFQFDINKEMKELNESLKELKIDLKNNLNQEELDKLQKDLEKEMEQLKKEIKNHSKNKRVIIHKKTGVTETEIDENTGYIYNLSSPDKLTSTVCAGISDEPIILSDMKNNHFTYTYCSETRELKKKSKFRTFMNKVIERILD